MKRFTMLAALVGFATMSVACGQTEDDLCDEARSFLQSCGSDLIGCDPAEASQVLSAGTCEAANASSKSDGRWEAEDYYYCRGYYDCWQACVDQMYECRTALEVKFNKGKISAGRCIAEGGALECIVVARYIDERMFGALPLF